MEYKSFYLIGSVAALTLMLGGCTQSSPSNHGKQAISSSVTKTNSNGSNNKSTQSSKLWNKSKDQQLSDFINKWAPTMEQSYTKYNGDSQLKNKAGVEYPKDLNKTTVNGSNASIGWAPSGKDPYEYNVVALYNYDRPGNAATHITYAFAFHDGQPVALVDQSTNGTPNWTPTKNTDVSSNFAKIANGESSSFKAKGNDNSNNSSSSSSSSSSDNNSAKIKDANDALAYLKQQKGDGNYTIAHGTFGMSDNPYATIDDEDNGIQYYVYQNGKIEEEDDN